MSDKFSLTKQIETIDGIIEDSKHDLKTARSAKSKRSAQDALNFFQSIKESLETLNVKQIQSVFE